LSFLDELRQMVQVASTKGKSAARTKARANLKQVGSALQDYAQESARVDARIAADVQEQAQQIEAEIRRLEELKTETRRVDGDPDFYFKQPPGRPEGDRGAVDPDRDFEKLSDWGVTDDGKAAPKDARDSAQDQAGGRQEQQRGELREKAAAQLEKLQTMGQEERVPQEKAAPQQPSDVPQGEREAGPVGLQPAVDGRSREETPEDGRAAPGAPAAAGPGHLLLDFDLALVGTPYHFRKLHGEPRLVLRARHESLGRFLTAIVWAGLCLVLATAAIYVLKRPNAAALAYRCWPWLGAAIGATWLFLLPAGVLGLALLVTTLCVLIARSRQRQATGSRISTIEQGTS
jgi:hypothetical protein